MFEQTNMLDLTTIITEKNKGHSNLITSLYCMFMEEHQELVLWYQISYLHAPTVLTKPPPKVPFSSRVHA